ncbi:hypothetical protein SAY86_020634 [Trapa natans]|uniref:Uncharacterized protein n=1 Tax=Trapa natans TaxID=22666 RepID=A0AAN7LNP9_TRANT|nr:hypothetical protein SAY86_020634 [Trapa natans]
MTISNGRRTMGNKLKGGGWDREGEAVTWQRGGCRGLGSGPASGKGSPGRRAPAPSPAPPCTPPSAPPVSLPVSSLPLQFSLYNYPDPPPIPSTNRKLRRPESVSA